MFENGYWMKKPIANANEFWLKSEGCTFKNCLDIGCGYRCFGSIGLDSSRFAIKQVKKPKVLGSVMNLPFKDNSFHETVCNFVLEHVLPGQAVQIAKECFRILKKGGKSYFVTEKFHKNFFGDYTHIHPFSTGSLRQLLKDAEFEEIKTKRSFPMAKGFNFLGRKLGEDRLFLIQRMTRPILWFKCNNIIGIGAKE